MMFFKHWSTMFLKTIHKLFLHLYETPTAQTVCHLHRVTSSKNCILFCLSNEKKTYHILRKQV